MRPASVLQKACSALYIEYLQNIIGISAGDRGNGFVI